MGKFLKTVFTDKGKQILFGSGNVTYTKAELYDQDTSNLTSDEIKALTSLSGVLLSTGAGVTSESKNTVSVHAVFSNRGLTDDISFKTVGWFAKAGDGAETLIAVSPLDGSKTLPAGAPDLSNNAIDLTLNISIGDATTVNVSIIPSDVVKPTDLENLRTLLSGEIDTKANQSELDKTNATVETKADKATVESDLATKANQSDLDKTNAEVAKKADSENVTTQLDTKADKTDVASAVKQLQDSIATKADAKTVNDAISKIDFTPYAKMVDVYSRKELDKKLLEMSTDTDGKVNADQVATMIEGKADKDDVDAKIKTVTDLANTKANASDVYTKKAVDDALSTRDSNITNAANLAKQAQDTANTKANSSDVYTKADVDGKTSGTVVTGYDIATKIPVKENTAYSSKWLVDNQVADVFADAINQLAGRRTVDAPDFNSLTDSGSYYVTNPSKGKNAPEGSWGNLLVSNGNGIRISQLYFPDSNANPYFRTWRDNNGWQPWVQLANTNQVNDAKNTATQANTNADSRLPLNGGNMTLRSTINWNGGGVNDKTGNLGGFNWAGGTDWAKIYGDQDGNDNLDLAFDLGDDGSNKFSFRKNGGEISAIQSNGHYTGSVDWGNVWGRPQDQVNRVNVITPLFRQIQNSNNWNDIFGVGNPNNVLTSLRIDSGGSGSLLNDFAAGIGFGGADTKGVLSVAYQNHQARITGGNGAGPVWSEDVAWKSDINDLRNQVQQLRENQFETQTFTDANAAANWEAQKPGKRLAVVNR